MALPPWGSAAQAGSGWPVWGLALMWIGMLAFLAFLIWAAYALITSTSRRARP
jgi:hypothetical protein